MLLIALLIAALVPPGPQASRLRQRSDWQAGGQAPTFKSSTSLVEVDIIARDKDGRFVSGLTADDFEVIEDGKPQTIEHFYLVTDRPTSTTDPRPDAVLPRAGDIVEGRVFVLFFDSDHLSNSALQRLQRTALDFVQENVHARDIAGVFVNGSLVNGHLTNDHAEIVAAIRGASPAFETSETRAHELAEYPRIDSYFEAQRIDGGDRGALDEAGTVNCGGDFARQCAAEGGREFVEDALQRKARTFIDDSRRAATATLQSLQYVIRNLSPMEGRKTLVLLSEGFYTEEMRSELPTVAGQASRAGVTIYAVDARGTAARGGVSMGDPSMQRNGLSGFGDSTDEALDVLSSETGGMTVRHTDDFSRAFADVANDTSTYYVLAYAPANQVLDGKFRHIQLKVKWEGLSVRARRGYVATPLPAPKQIRTRGGTP